MPKSKDAKRLKEYNIDIYTKGFVATSILNGITTNDFFHYKKIYNILHHKNIGIEIICHNGTRRVFYHDLDGESEYLFNLVSDKMVTWMQSNKN